MSLCVEKSVQKKIGSRVSHKQIRAKAVLKNANALGIHFYIVMPAWQNDLDLMTQKTYRTAQNETFSSDGLSYPHENTHVLRYQIAYM